MAITIKTKEEIEILRECGRRLATILYKVKDRVAPGVSAKDLDKYAQELIAELGDKPAFLNYSPEGAKTPFPAALCVSLNDEVVHGIPTAEKILKEGDIVGIDLGLNHRGMLTDMAITVPVGKISPELQKLLDVTKEALEVGIFMAHAGGKVGDIGHAIAEFVKPHKYGVVEVLAGHGVGKAVHEYPFVPNFGKKGTGAKLVPGMVLAIEPMLTMDSKEVFLEKDGYTFRSQDGKPTAHFEHTVLITEGEPEILTKV